MVKNDNLYDFCVNKNIECISVGTLSNDVLNLLNDKLPDKKLELKNRTILLWKDRLQHIQKHSFDTEELSFDEYVQYIPDILSEPDYIGYREKDESIQYVKKIKNNILVAVRLSNAGKLSFRTMYSITEGQLNDYIKKDKMWKFIIDK